MLFPVKVKRDEIRFIQLASIYYIEADGDDIHDGNGAFMGASVD